MIKQAINPILLITGLICILLACTLGSTNMSLVRVLGGFLGTGQPVDQIVIWQIRLPRALTAYMVGAALGMSGAALQGLLRNPLAEPGVLGVSASASLGAVISIYYGAAAVSLWALPVFAIIGALIGTFIIAAAALRTHSVVTLILVGVGLSSFAGAALSFLMNMSPNPFTLSDMINWMLGSVANRSFSDLALSAPFILAGMLTLIFSARGLSVLTLGEEAASGLGLDLQRQRLIVILGTGMATGGAVALAGAVGFLGIVVPHLVRPLVNHDPGRSLLPAALAGGSVLVLTDIGVRLLPTVNELKLGVVAALFGAPVFIWIAIQQRSANV